MFIRQLQLEVSQADLKDLTYHQQTLCGLDSISHVRVNTVKYLSVRKCSLSHTSHRAVQNLRDHNSFCLTVSHRSRRRARVK